MNIIQHFLKALTLRDANTLGTAIRPMFGHDRGKPHRQWWSSKLHSNTEKPQQRQERVLPSDVCQWGNGKTKMFKNTLLLTICVCFSADCFPLTPKNDKRTLLFSREGPQRHEEKERPRWDFTQTVTQGQARHGKQVEDSMIVGVAMNHCFLLLKSFCHRPKQPPHP
jgi:hypothetical protein